jgi:hypothetical protein
VIEISKCKDGRKHIIVNKYKKKDGTTVKSHERSCPSTTSLKEEYFLCCLCGEEIQLDDRQDVQVKGETRQICNECVDTIHGLV